MQLIGSKTSPFVRKVRVFMSEKEIDYEFKVDSPWEEGSTVPQHNPLGKIPILLLPDATSVYDSSVIIEYLEANNTNKTLIPSGANERYKVLVWQALADGMADAAATIFLEQKRPQSQQSQEWINRQRGKIDLALLAASTQLENKNWCHNQELTLADISVGCSLGYLDFRFAEIDWRSKYANLADLSERLFKRPSFAQTVPQV